MLTRDGLDDRDLYIITQLEGQLKSVDIDFFVELCTYNEDKVAYEDLCTQIHEFDVKVSKKVFNLLKDVCVQHGIEEYYWKNLEGLIVD